MPWEFTDTFDVNALGDSPFDMDLQTLAIHTDAAEALARDELQRVERAIAGAIRSGYDGVDINHPDPLTHGLGIVSIEPWRRPPPNGANGYRTERYSWDWFSDDELTQLLTTDDPRDVLTEE